MNHHASAVSVVCTVWSASPATMYSIATSLSESQKSLSQPRTSMPSRSRTRTTSAMPTSHATTFGQPAAARVVAERRDGVVTVLTAALLPRSGSRARGSAHGQQSDVDVGRQLGRVLRERLCRCAEGSSRAPQPDLLGTCPSGSGPPRGRSNCSASAAVRGSRWPGGRRAPHPAIGSSATSRPGRARSSRRRGQYHRRTRSAEPETR